MTYKNVNEMITTSPLRWSHHIMKEWQRIKPILELKYIVSVRETTPLYAEKYRFDLYGMLRDIFFIDETFIYPHIIVNGYDSSTSYDGNKLRFSIINPQILVTYHRLFTRNYERDVELGRINPVG